MRFALILLLILIAPIMAQAQSLPPSPKPTHATSEMRTELFEVKHRDPVALVESIVALGSGSPASRIDQNRALKTITVRDYPENVETIRAALARLDKPERASANLDLQLHVVAATRTPGDKGPLPAGLDAVVNQLRQTLKYGGYRYVTSFLHRISDGGDIVANGTTDPIFPIADRKDKGFYAYNLKNVDLIADSAGKEAIKIQAFSFHFKEPIVRINPNNQTYFDHSDVRFSTELSMNLGEMVVVGTANVGSSEEAVIVIITAKKSN